MEDATKKRGDESLPYGGGTKGLTDMRVRHSEQGARSDKTESFFLIPRNEEGLILGNRNSVNIFLAFRNKLLYKFFRSLGLLKKRAYSPLFF